MTARKNATRQPATKKNKVLTLRDGSDTRQAIIRVDRIEAITKIPNAKGYAIIMASGASIPIATASDESLTALIQEWEAGISN